METSNSISSVLNNLIKLQRNNTEILTKLSQLINSDTDSVTFTIEDIANNNIKTITLPSFGSTKKDIERLDLNIQQLSGLGSSNATVQLPDGTFRTVTKSTLKRSANDLVKVKTPTEFATKNNWFFESFLNPFLYCGLSFPNQLNPDTQKVKMQKFILNLDTDAKLSIYNESIKNNPDLSYSDFLDLINENGITYSIDDDILDLPPIENRYYGNFSVLRVFETSENILVNGVSANKKTQKFQLDKLNYNDKNSVQQETQQLKIGDSLLVNKNNKNTRYKITSIDFETTTVSVQLVEGYDSVSIGSEILSYYPTEVSTPEIRIGIGFNEYLSVFLKPIDPVSNRPADNYSPGISFYTNELLIKDTDGVIKSLDAYYKEKVVDFGAVLFSMTQENIPPVSKAVIPNAPELSKDDFKVVQINKHATDGQSNETIKSLNKDKLSLKSELQELDKSISLKRKEMSIKNYKSDIERDSDFNSLTTLINKRSATETQLNSVISDIITKGQDKGITSSSAKYRLRGFWNIPQSKLASDGTTQEIIQFKIEYRYSTKGGSPNNIEEYAKGSFSNWIPVKTTLREREFDATTGKYFWKPQDPKNSEQININQLDLPISENETVEFRIKSISEAGYPTNPIESDWSEIISFDFPDDLGISKDVLSILKETNEEKIKANLNEDLVQKGVFKHLDDQFIQNNITWKHNSSNIASGWLSTERNVISLYDYLKFLEDKISALESKLNQEVGSLLVKLQDDSGNQIVVQENTTVSIFGGNYKDLVSSLDEPKGSIITKNYFIRLENSVQTPIQLLAYFDSINNSGSKFEKVTSTDYNFANLGLSNPNTTDIDNITKTAFYLPFQSSQVKGQFLYIRNKDITGTKTLYEKLGQNLINSVYYFKNDVTGTTDNYLNNNQYFVWDGTQPSDSDIQGVQPFNFGNDKIYVHCEHPDFKGGLVVTDNHWVEQNTTVSAFAKRNLSDADYYQQSSFVTGKLITNTTLSNKTSFKENDKYLLGSASCGSYLYLSPLKYEDIRVNGNDKVSYKELKYGNNNALVFQIVYQFRMTDYFGPGTTGIGKIAGLDGVTQLEYRNILGFDIFWDKKKFSFDLEVFSRYKSNTISASDVPNSTFQNTISSMNANFTPNL